MLGLPDFCNFRSCYGPAYSHHCHHPFMYGQQYSMRYSQLVIGVRIIANFGLSPTIFFASFAGQLCARVDL